MHHRAITSQESRKIDVVCERARVNVRNLTRELGCFPLEDAFASPFLKCGSQRQQSFQPTGFSRVK
jgi:hypothetical protein